MKLNNVKTFDESPVLILRKLNRLFETKVREIFPFLNTNQDKEKKLIWLSLAYKVLIDEKGASYRKLGVNPGIKKEDLDQIFNNKAAEYFQYIGKDRKKEEEFWDLILSYKKIKDFEQYEDEKSLEKKELILKK